MINNEITYEYPEIKQKHNLLPYQDIINLANFTKLNDVENLKKYIIDLQSQYSNEILRPVLKSLYFAKVGTQESKEIIKMLYNDFVEFEFYSPYYKDCSGGEWEEIAKQENIDLVKLISNLNQYDICSNNLNKNTHTIPHILHNVWTTQSSKNDLEKLEIFKKNNLYLDSNYKITSNWQHNIWFTDEKTTSEAIILLVKSYGF
jgi:hypothetical protein